MRTLDAFKAVVGKLDLREFAKKPVPGDVKQKILEAARETGSSMNSQHWRFILLQSRRDIDTLARDGTTGGWVAGADFAVIILTNPRVPGYSIDAGRALQDMEVAAWNFGVASGLFTGFKQADLRRDFAIPSDMEISAALGFGYPLKRQLGRKNRKPLEEIVFIGRYGNRLTPADLG